MTLLQHTSKKITAYIKIKINLPIQYLKEWRQSM